MSDKNVPRTIDDVTNDWLSGVLKSEVTDYQVTFLEGGVLSDAYKLHNITYKVSTEAPASVVLKMANQVEDRRAYALSNNAYVKELRFFSDLADDVPLTTPIIYNITEDGSADSEF